MATGTRKYHVTTDNLKVIQKFYLDFTDNTAYVLQIPGGSQTDMALTYGHFDPNSSEIDLKNGSHTTVNLNNFGHGQTFEVFKDTDGSKWAWVATYASPTQTDSLGDHWASRIGVIPLDGSASIDASSVHSITYLNYLGTGATKNMSMHRVDAALSSDATRLAIWTQSSGSASSATKRVTALNAKPLFEALKNGNINAKTNAGMVKGGKYYVSSRDISGYEYPQNSWQGMELSNRTSAGYNWVYLSSGQAANNKTVLVRAPWNFTSPAPQSLTVSVPGVTGQHETEALQLHGDYVYFGVEEKISGGNNHYIYSIPKADFTN
ncbi:helveticin J family class III bacteriocin [uncultured Secundilactobacillus sp.]|uniref:helveticin J family class III bacteriocin n=1 Tax=uncultured Secundilactobacillus sp. TaxID=2813935 RepID=UPI0025835187|nr:helveticin J family class III bacteriocin [uncultured Secundilactobacillus sp.]